MGHHSVSQGGAGWAACGVLAGCEGECGDPGKSLGEGELCARF